MSDEQLKDRIPVLRVIAGAIPSDKQRLVIMAQQCKKVVGKISASLSIILIWYSRDDWRWRE